MAKCIASRTDWRVNKIQLDDISFITDTAKAGEKILNSRLTEIKYITRSICKDYFKIKNSTRHEDDRCDCYQTHDDLINKLDNLLTEVPSVIDHIIKSNLMTVSKHRYFLHFSHGVIEKVKQMLMIVGRLNDLDQEIYLKEQHKSLISNESIVIHSLVEIWSASIEIMRSFRASAEELFDKEFQSEDYNFIKESDFYTLSTKYSQIFLADLIITAWFQFNRLVKYNDFLKGLTFLCPCNGKTFSRILRIILDDGDNEFLLKLLASIRENDKYSCDSTMLQTETIREMNTIPMLPCYSRIDDKVLAYFRIWFIYSLLRILSKSTEEGDLKILAKCDTILLSAFDTVMQQYIPAPNSDKHTFRLSPNQEEKFKLMFAMLDRWCDTYKKSIALITKMFTYFDTNWTPLGDRYFDDTDHRIEGLTIFQLFTKLVYEAIPIRIDQDGHATKGCDQDGDRKNLTSEEKKLDDIWTKLLDRISQKSKNPQATVTASTSGSGIIYGASSSLSID